MSRFDIGLDVDIGIKGGLILFGFLLLAAATIADIFTAPDTFAALFYVGVGAILIGFLMFIIRGND